MKYIYPLIISALILSSCTDKIPEKVATTVEYVKDVKEAIAPVPSVILKNGLPSKHQIRVNFVPQAPEKNWDQPWQDACEEASLLTVKYYYQSSTPDLAAVLSDYQQIFSYETQNNLSHDINQNTMASVALKHLNLTPKIIDNPTIMDIKTYLSQDIPVIITANGKTLYQENKRFRSGGPWYHSLVIIGYDDNSQKFTVNDVGTQFGANFKYSYDLLMDSIHDYPETNNKEDINNGAKRILILLK